MARFEVSFQELPDLAAAAGPADALFELGLAYCSGRDGEIDLIEAHKWFNLAALRGNGDAKRYRSELASEMSRDEIGQAQRRAREWLSRH
jgi:TPR repeat protein